VKLEIPEIVLASTSPRRQRLLTQVGIPFDVLPPNGVEEVPTGGDFGQVVMRNAESKALSVVSLAAGRIILGADTIVELDGQPLGKPADTDQARMMLEKLSAREHLVHTGIALVDPTRKAACCDHVVTRVLFRELSRDEIDDYIRSGEPFDKAGSYGIQERGALFIRQVEGCFFNVMGLPLARMWELLMTCLTQRRRGADV